MIGRKILDSKVVTIGEVKELLESGDSESLGFEQTKTLDYVKKVSKIDREIAEKMMEELMIIEKISREKAAKIADILPRSNEEIKVIFVKEIYPLNDEEMAKVLEIVDRYGKEEKKEKK